MRIALAIEYNGHQYHGWQSQPGLHTIQDHVEQALSVVANHKVRLVCAGRTDTGVHATNQIAHFDTNSKRSPQSWVRGANSNLPKDISVRWAKAVQEDFHARFSALSRRYCYVIYNNPIRPATLRTNITWQYHPLDHERMLAAANHLIGEHDFTSFRASECQSKTAMRNIHAIDIKRSDDLIILAVTANAFLQRMVRNVVGVLMAVGFGKRDTSWTKEVLEARDRTLGAETAPAYGLYLVNVKYPQRYALNNTPINPMFLTNI